MTDHTDAPPTPRPARSSSSDRPCRARTRARTSAGPTRRRFSICSTLRPRSGFRYSTVQSEEGGRFYRYQNRYMILELPEGLAVESSETHRWMTLGQSQSLLPHGDFNIEARNLLACLDLCHGASA